MSVLWAVKRRLIYLSGLFLVIAAAIGSVSFLAFNDPPTCFDGAQNQNEEGVDCGGTCQILCPFQVTPPVAQWSRTLPVTDTIYNAVAYVENPNAQAGVRRMSYTFEIYDANNSLITKREGTTYLEPNSVTPVFEPSINAGNRAPTRTFFDFELASPWERVTNSNSPFRVESKVLSDVDTNPRLTATIRNTSIQDYTNVEATAVILNSNDNAIATSRTVIPKLPRQSQQEVVYTWPQPLKRKLEACVAASEVALLLDVSGSMNDDGQNPPQPLTDAKQAAQTFIDSLSERDNAGLVTFATDGALVQTLTNDLSQTRQAIGSLSIEPEEEQGYTNIGAAISIARQELGAVTDPDELKKAIVLLTDGRANRPEEPGGEVYAMDQGDLAKQSNISMYTIGLGNNVNADFLRNLASDPQQYYQAAESEELASIYEQVSAAICERGPAIINITPRAQSAFFTDVPPGETR